MGCKGFVQLQGIGLHTDCHNSAVRQCYGAVATQHPGCAAKCSCKLSSSLSLLCGHVLHFSRQALAGDHHYHPLPWSKRQPVPQVLPLTPCSPWTSATKK